MKPSWRKPVGGLLIIALIVIWAALVASLSGMVGGWPVLVQGIFYLVAGLVWIVPLRPLIRWIQTGRWRVAQPANIEP